MIIKKLVMHNFGVYASTNSLEFNGNKPIILIGGMNGRGKTTILEAVLLGLYGANSFAYMESRYKTYGQYLRSYINNADGTLETFIEIEFMLDITENEVYYVHREWNGKGQRVHEKVLVKKNGEESSFLTENWLMFVENVLPSALSSFFFFDGEKIAELAVDDTSEQMKKSIKAMLGISVLDQLEIDLGRIIRSTAKKSSDKQDLVKLDKLREKKEYAIKALSEIDEEIEQAEKQLTILHMNLEKKNTEYIMKGGDIVEHRHDLMKQRSDTMSAIMNSQDLLLELAGGELPLAMVLPLLKDIQEQAQAEQETKISLMAYDKIKQLYRSFPQKTSEIDYFVDFVKKETLAEDKENIYNLSDSVLYQITALNKEGLVNCKRRVEEIILNCNQNKEKVEEFDRYLSVDIDETALAKIYKKIIEIEQNIATAEVKIENLNRNRAELHGIAMMAEAEFAKMAEYVLSSMESIDADERIRKYTHIATEIVSRYKIRLQERKTDILAQTMTDCYKKLANKKNLVDRIEMDSNTLDLHYISIDGEEIAKKRLSAGEKQLMVIALLWALAICSKQKLPVIIDTPLSRLDSSHRQALVKTYFPYASEQTIILSTDSEIDERYYHMMKDNIGDEFTLKYNDQDRRTTITPGYFGWGGNE